ncbi:DUF5926 family protein [Skermania piniformis]|uniref:DUF5926 domain-containing protein n=1 Tax=Skermania pinensis TaxID=39122 RepID=A0ABX8S832_9ACTN|nr:DUF5926 family protein [Skermania piniformis]QXQ14005.1 hypothetical protein KV203_00590 [Skermania piniformis]
MGKSKRNTPKPGGNRAQRLADRQAEREQGGVAAARPFQGLAAECDLVALREFVPSATAPLPVAEGSRAVVLATVLPGAVAGLARVQDGTDTGYVGIQTQHESANPSRDLAAAIGWAQNSALGDSLATAEADASTPELSAVIDAGVPLEITVHADFNWWIPAGVQPDPQVAATVERANAAIMPSARLSGLDAAWWVDAGERAHLRWVRPEPEDALMLALARLHAGGFLSLGEGSRFAGSFRTHGLLVPVFDLDRERHPDEWIDPATEFGKRLAEAAASDVPLSSAERRSRDGLRSRQITLR